MSKQDSRSLLAYSQVEKGDRAPKTGSCLRGDAVSIEHWQVSSRGHSAAKAK